MGSSSRSSARWLVPVTAAVIAFIIGGGLGFSLGADSVDSAASDDGRGSSDAQSGETEDAQAAETPNEPNVGDRALRVGETREGSAVSTTVLQVEDDYREAAYQPPTNGGRYLGAEVETCLTDETNQDSLVSWSNFEAGNESGQSFPAASSMYEGFPASPYPFTETALKSGCRKGWVLIEIPEGADVDRVRFNPSDPLAEWLF